MVVIAVDKVYNRKTYMGGISEIKSK